MTVDAIREVALQIPGFLDRERKTIYEGQRHFCDPEGAQVLPECRIIPEWFVDAGPNVS
jgi:hypothetical protein